MTRTEENSSIGTIYKKYAGTISSLVELYSEKDLCGAIGKCLEETSAKTKLSICLRITPDDFVTLSNKLKSRLWKKHNRIENFQFTITFYNRDELSIDFAMSLSLFSLWRNDYYDSFIFDCCELTSAEEITAFKSKVARFFHYILSDKEIEMRVGPTYNQNFIQIQIKENGLLGLSKISRASGGFGDTGFPIIPIIPHDTLKKNNTKYLPMLYQNLRVFMSDSKSPKTLSEIVNLWLKAKPSPEHRRAELSWSNGAIRVIIREFLVDIWSKEYFKNSPIHNTIVDYFDNMNVITFMFFIAAFSAIYTPKQSGVTTDMRKEIFSDFSDFTALCEKCNLFAMGELQLIENVNNYTSGGFFALRALMRSEDGKGNKEIEKEVASQRGDWDFLAVRIADLAKVEPNEGSVSDCKNMEEVLRDNLKRKNITVDSVDSKEVFWGTDQKSPYQDYLSDNKNISHHYGLRIFTHTVVETDGHFSVISGNNKNCSCWKFDSNQLKTKIAYQGTSTKEYFCGTEYRILLPVKLVAKESEEKKESILSKHVGYFPNDLTFKWIKKVKDGEIEEVAWEEIKKVAWEAFTLDKDEEASLICNSSKKEDTINLIIKNITDTYFSHTGIKILSLDCNKISSKYRQFHIEIIAKVIFGLAAEEKFASNNFVVKFSNISEILSFITFYSCFYDRLGRIHLKNKKGPQILLVDTDSTTYNSEKYTFSVMLSGSYLGRPLYDYRQFSGGANQDNSLDDIFNSVFRLIESRNKILAVQHESITKNNPHYFDSIKVSTKNKIERLDFLDEIELWKSELNNVLNTSITEKFRYGVLIKDVHIHISRVHLDRFYKVESLFTNAYWASKFGEYLSDKIADIIRFNPKTKVILFGYERMVEPTLIHTKNLFRETGNVDYMIFDAGYHYSAEGLAHCKLRDDQVNADKEGFDRIVTLFVTPINTTLQTFFQMAEELSDSKKSEASNYRKLIEGFDKEDLQNNYRYFTFIHVYNEDKCGNHSDLYQYISRVQTRFDGTIRFNKYNLSITDNATTKECDYLIAVPAKWSKPEHCQACYPNNGDELAIFSTDDSSLVPTLMLERMKDTKSAPGHTESNLVDFFSYSFDKSQKMKYDYQSCLYRGHIERGGSHYRSYIRTDFLSMKVAKILDSPNENKAEKKKIISFIEKIQKELNLNDQSSGNEDTIHIIVAPYHSTNQRWVSLVNEKVFSGDAHIIGFSALKSYRSNFMAEFDNYSDLIAKIGSRIACGSASLRSKSPIDYKNLIKFYYVDDQINTGDTYYRSRSLIRGLVSRAQELMGDRGNIDANGFRFSAVILLTDRHSNSTRDDIIGKDNYFALYEFSTPHLRSYADTCPLCKQVAQDKDYLKQACQDFIARICAERRMAHKVVEISEIEKRVKASKTNIQKSCKNAA